jgi:transposase-like protein
LDFMPITPTNPFKGRQYPGELILLCVRWYLRYPLAYGHVAEIIAERGVAVDARCIWRWVQAYGPELNKRCRQHGNPQPRVINVDKNPAYPAAIEALKAEARCAAVVARGGASI